MLVACSVLTGVVTSSKAYIDCLYSLAQSAQVCKGATSEIGEKLTHIMQYLLSVQPRHQVHIWSFVGLVLGNLSVIKDSWYPKSIL